jgi:hypothetical protein
MIQITQASEGVRWTNLSGDALIKLAEQRMRGGLAPPPEIYRIEYRRRIDWLKFPDWARPVDPELFDGCCHEG